MARFFEPDQVPNSEFQNAKIDERDPQGRTILHAAARSRNLTAVESLFGHSALLAAVDFDGETPLHCAVRGGSEAVIDAVCRAGSKDTIEVKNMYGLTALALATKIACWQPDRGIAAVQVLLKLGASPSGQSTTGGSMEGKPAGIGVTRSLDLGGFIDVHRLPTPPKEDESWMLAWGKLHAALTKAFWSDENSIGIQLFSAASIKLFELCNRRRAHADFESQPQKLYLALYGFITNLCEDIAKAVPTDDRDSALAFYSRASDRYSRLESVVVRLFRYLHRHWVMRQRDENKIKISPNDTPILGINELCLTRWNELVVFAGKSILPSVLGLTERTPREAFSVTKEVDRSAEVNALAPSEPRTTTISELQRRFERFFNVSREESNLEHHEKLLSSVILSDFIRYSGEPESPPIDVYNGLHPPAERPLVDKLNSIISSRDHIALYRMRRLIPAMEFFVTDDPRAFVSRLHVAFNKVKWDDVPSESVWVSLEGAITSSGFNITRL